MFFLILRKKPEENKETKFIIKKNYSSCFFKKTIGKNCNYKKEKKRKNKKARRKKGKKRRKNGKRNKILEILIEKLLNRKKKKSK